VERSIELAHVRNIGIMAHIDAGKTTVSERLLYYSGKTYKIGEVHDGAATMDWMEQERERGITITSAATTFTWQDHDITLIDTPGHIDFTAEVERSLRVLDGAVALFCAVGGVQPQSEQVWKQSEKYGVPKIAYINKMDRDGADYFGVVEKIRDILGACAIPVVIPIGQAERFHGIINLIDMQAVLYTGDGLEQDAETVPIPAEVEALAKEWRAKLAEACAEQDDASQETFLTTGDLPSADIRRILRKATVSRKVIPVYCGSALKNKGIRPLLDGVVNFLPSPADLPPVVGIADGAPAERAMSDDAPFSALAFKITSDKHAGKLTYLRVYSGVIHTGDTIANTTRQDEQRVGRLMRMHANRSEAITEARTGDIVAAVGLGKTKTGDSLCDPQHPIILEAIEFPAPVMSISIKPQSRMDSEKTMEALHRLAEEDPTFFVKQDPETSETILSGMGELHLEILVDRLKREFGVGVTVGPPEVAFRETITATVEGQYKHVKQTGGRGQYAHVWLRIEPMPKGEGFEFVDEVRSGHIPSEYIPAVEKGVIRAMERGPLAGYPVVDVRVIVFDGSYHEVDSSDAAFQEAAWWCFRDLYQKAKPRLIEPVMSLEITMPEEYMGGISGSIGQRRGRIDDMDAQAGHRVIRGMAPLSEMFGYSNVIRTLSQGRAGYTMQFEHYEAVPASLAEAIIRKRREQDKVH
jgi:elongation factor G